MLRSLPVKDFRRYQVRTRFSFFRGILKYQQSAIGMTTHGAKKIAASGVALPECLGDEPTLNFPLKDRWVPRPLPIASHAGESNATSPRGSRSLQCLATTAEVVLGRYDRYDHPVSHSIDTLSLCGGTMVATTIGRTASNK